MECYYDKIETLTVGSVQICFDSDKNNHISSITFFSYSTKFTLQNLL